MTNNLRVMVEIGPKGKKVVAVAPEWPGLARGAKTEALAIERLRTYLPRYVPVAKLAGMEAAFASATHVSATDVSATDVSATDVSATDVSATDSSATDIDVVERYPGTGSTDFWGISFAFSSIDHQPMSSEKLERELTLMRACWTFFDEVRARVSAELQRGPRGGGRDRDRIVQHTVGVELDWAKGLGVVMPLESLLTDDERLQEYRNAYCSAIRSFHAEDKMAGKWPLHYLIRHTAFHTLDHAWEMEDKDLTGK